MSEGFSDHPGVAALCNQIAGLIDDFISDNDISVAEAIGVLSILQLSLAHQSGVFEREEL